MVPSEYSELIMSEFDVSTANPKHGSDNVKINRAKNIGGKGKKGTDKRTLSPTIAIEVRKREK
jgi:hypothetical protein